MFAVWERFWERTPESGNEAKSQWRFAANIVCQDSDARSLQALFRFSVGMLPVLCIRETCSRDRFAGYAIQGWTRSDSVGLTAASVLQSSSPAGPRACHYPAWKRKNLMPRKNEVQPQIRVRMGLLVDPFGLHERRSNRAIRMVSGGMARERTRILATVISHRSDAVRSDNIGVEIH
jgi:hypothetical protein